MTPINPDRAEQLLALQRRIKSAEAESNRLKGQKDAALARLKAEFGIETVEEASAKLVVLEARSAELGRIADNALETFEQKFAGGLVE